MYEDSAALHDEQNGSESYRHLKVHPLPKAIQDLMQLKHPDDKQRINECCRARPRSHLEICLGDV